MIFLLYFYTLRGVNEIIQTSRSLLNNCANKIFTNKRTLLISKKDLRKIIYKNNFSGDIGFKNNTISILDKFPVFEDEEMPLLRYAVYLF